MDIVNEREKSLETLLLKEAARNYEIRKFSVVIRQQLYPKILGARPPNKRGNDEVAVFDLELLFRINKKNQWSRAYFKFKEPKTSSSMGQNKRKPENVASTDKSDVVKPSANFHIIYLKDYE